MPRPLRTPRPFRASVALLLAGSSLLSGCAVSQSAITGQRRAYAFSWSQETRIGRAADEDMIRQFGLYEDPELNAYVARVGEAVLATSHLRRTGAEPELAATPFTFRVLDTPTINAFALPGGYVYVTRGLLAHLDNEAQLAVVLGHEVAHVAARHTAQRMLQAGLAMVGLVGASLLGEELWGAGDEVAAAGGLGLNMLLLGHSRGHESESDELGVEYAARAGYRAAEGADFFTLLGRTRQEEGWTPAFLSTHPDPGQREQRVRDLAATWEAQGVGGERVSEDEFLARLEGIVVGDDPRQGFVNEGEFFHPEHRFRFKLPLGWTVEHGEGGVRMTERSERAILVLRPDPESRSARDAADAYVRGQDSLFSVVRAEPTWVGALQAFVVDGQRVEAADTARMRLTFLELDGKVFRFGAAAVAADFDAHAPTFEQTIRSFAPLTDQRMLSVEAPRLRVRAVETDAPFRSLLPRALPFGMDADALARMNGLASADEVVPAGRKVKIPYRAAPTR